MTSKHWVTDVGNSVDEGNNVGLDNLAVEYQLAEFSRINFVKILNSQGTSSAGCCPKLRSINLDPTRLKPSPTLAAIP